MYKEQRERWMFSLQNNIALHWLSHKVGPVPIEQCDKTIIEGSGMGQGQSHLAKKPPQVIERHRRRIFSDIFS